MQKLCGVSYINSLFYKRPIASSTYNRSFVTHNFIKQFGLLNFLTPDILLEYHL